MKASVCISMVVLLAGCGVDQAEYDRALAQIKELEQKVDELENGEDRLIAEIDSAMTNQDYPSAREGISQLAARHPESSKNREYAELLPEIEKRESELADQRAAEEAEQRRLANLNNTGIWAVSHFVDDFGDPTENAYIQNRQPIKGLFSNSATEDSDLLVRFLADAADDIAIMLFEYAGNNPVKAYSATRYDVLVQNSGDVKLSLSAVNSSDRLRLNQNDSRKLHELLLQGGQIEFRIRESETPIAQYSFNIADAEFYDNAYRILTEEGSE